MVDIEEAKDESKDFPKPTPKVAKETVEEKKQQVTLKDERSVEHITKLYITAAQRVMYQAGVVLALLQEHKESHTVNKYETTEFFVMINLLTRIQALLAVCGWNWKQKRRNECKFVLIHLVHRQTQFSPLSTSTLAELRSQPAIQHYRLPLMQLYLQLMGYLKAAAFLLQEMGSYSSLSGAMDNIMDIAKLARSVQRVHDRPTEQKLLAQCLVLLDIVLEEQCLPYETLPDTFGADWCRIARFEDGKVRNKKKTSDNSVHKMLIMRRLLLDRLNVLKTQL